MDQDQLALLRVQLSFVGESKTNADRSSLRRISTKQVSLLESRQRLPLAFPLSAFSSLYKLA